MTAHETKSVERIAEALLVALSVLAVAGFWRLFDNWDFFWRLTGFAVASHALAVLGRRRGWHMGVVVAVSLAGLAVYAGIALYWSTTTFGIPSFDTFDSIRFDISHAYDEFNAVRPPAPVTRPLLLSAGVFVWWAAMVADWAAFRLRFGFEALVPVGAVFIFGALLGEPRGQVPLTGLFVLVALGFLLAHRVARQQETVGWIGRAGSNGPAALLRVGMAVVALAALGAAIAGPMLPGSDADPIWNVRPGEGVGDGSSRKVTSPLVEIRKRLLDQSNVELFTVRSNQRAYWRLTALDEFDGDVWHSDGTYSGASGSLSSDIDRNGPVATITQDVSIKALESPWLPAAFEARKVSSTARITWSSDLSTLIIGGTALSADGITYTVQSVAPIFDRPSLENAGADIPDKVRSTDLALPGDFSPTAAADAAEATAGQTTTYGRALALQDWFRANFTYDQSVTTGESNSAIDEFLASRRGYCQQFAGTYAAMARDLGIPARVAVGYTTGEADANDPTLYHVKGTHAHAWPEVYIGGQGWVPFEPTPGRGIPNAESYTGVPEQQSTGPDSAPTTAPATTEVPATTAPGATATTVKEQQQELLPLRGHVDRSAPFFTRWYGRAALLVLVLAAMAALYAVAVPALNRRRRRVRRAAATRPDAQVGVAWDEGVDSVALLGLVPARSETPAEFAERVEPTGDGEQWARLAELVGVADYADISVEADDAREALDIAEAIHAQVRARIPARQRWRAELDPRSRERRLRTRAQPGPGRRPRSRRDAPAIEVVELPRP